MKREEIEKILSKYTDSQVFEITSNLEVGNPMQGTFSKKQTRDKTNTWLINEFISSNVTQETELPGEFIVKIKPIDK